MRQGILHWIASGVAVVSLASIGCGHASAAGGKSHRAVGKNLPGLSLHGLTGESEAVDLGGIKDKVAVLHFWGTWCPDCVREFPGITGLYKKHAEEPHFLMLAISSGESEDANVDQLRRETEQFIEKQKVALPTYVDQADRTRTAVERTCGWEGYPCTVVLDKHSAIRGVWLTPGAKTTEQIDELVTELLAE